MKKVLVIIGPTAVGKTALSVALAKKYGGEIISGDSIQVYRGFDIGSAKASLQERQGIPHHCIDILDKKAAYSVYDFQCSARKAIEEISKRRRLPIIAGGTGLYIKAALYDYHFEQQQSEDPKKIQEKYSGLTNEELYERLKKCDEQASAAIHPNNRKRVIRALEIAENDALTKSENLARQQHRMIFDVLMIGLTMERGDLYERINKRVQMMCDAGLEAEIKGLLEDGVTFEDRAMQGIGYREWQGYFEGTLSKAEVVELIQKNSRQFAKRQYTWFNNQFDVRWIDVQKEDAYKKACEMIDEWRGEENERGF